jgi:hypothetical protein
MVLSTIQTVELLVGIYYYIAGLRNKKKTKELTLKAQEHATETRQLDIYMKYQMIGIDPEFYNNYFEVTSLEWENFDDFARKYSHTENPEEAVA